MKDAALGIIGIAIVVLLLAANYQNHRRFHKPQITTPYQAVTLVDGSVFYGRIDHLGTDHPVLRNAFTVARQADGADGQPRYTLARRSAGINGGDHLVFPVSSLLMVEPVRPDSVVGRLIEQSR